MIRIAVSDPGALEAALNVLQSGGMVIVPTDTVYGLSCDATNEMAIEKIFRLKARSQEKALPVFVADLSMAQQIARIDDTSVSILSRFWPGAMTGVFFAQPVLPELLHQGTPAIALRIPNNEFILNLVRELGRPIVATSANTSGAGSQTKIENVLKNFHETEEPDLVIDGGDLPDNIPSTVVDFTKMPPVVLRAGAVPKEEFLKVVEGYTIK